MKVSFFFAWYDFWVGFFYDQKKRVLYICPLPCCVIKVELQPLPRIAADICVRCGAFLLADDVTLHKCNDRRFTQLLDADGRPIFEGDLLSVGMRVGDASGWTVEVVAWNNAAGEWGLLDLPTRTEFMQMQRDQRLRKLTGQSVQCLGGTEETR